VAGIQLAGIGLIAVSVLLGRWHPVQGIGLSRANALCASPLGGLARAFSASAGQACGQIQAAEQVRGWAMVLGVALLCAGIAGAAVLLAEHRARSLPGVGPG
jgi:hypothetical protein